MTSSDYHDPEQLTTESGQSDRPNGFIVLMPHESQWFAELGAIGATAMSVYLQIKAHARPDERTAWPSLARIEELTGLSDKTVRTAAKLLDDCPFVTVTHFAGRKPNRYTFTAAAWPDKPATGQNPTGYEAKNGNRQNLPGSESNAVNSTGIDDSKPVNSTDEVDPGFEVDPKTKVDPVTADNDFAIAKSNVRNRVSFDFTREGRVTKDAVRVVRDAAKQEGFAITDAEALDLARHAQRLYGDQLSQYSLHDAICLPAANLVDRMNGASKRIESPVGYLVALMKESAREHNGKVA